MGTILRREIAYYISLISFFDLSTLIACSSAFLVCRMLDLVVCYVSRRLKQRNSLRKHLRKPSHENNFLVEKAGLLNLLISKVVQVLIDKVVTPQFLMLGYGNLGIS